jgi:hypothetical protein
VTPTQPAAAPPEPGGATGPDGSLSLEMALALPVLAVCLVALLQGVGLLRDVLVVQASARHGARTAATTTDDGAVVAAVTDAAGSVASVTVSPSGRGPGDTVTVEVVMTTRFGPLRPRVTGKAAARGEPILGVP